MRSGILSCCWFILNPFLCQTAAFYIEASFKLEYFWRNNQPAVNYFRWHQIQFGNTKKNISFTSYPVFESLTQWTQYGGPNKSIFFVNGIQSLKNHIEIENWRSKIPCLIQRDWQISTMHVPDRYYDWDKTPDWDIGIKKRESVWRKK